MMCVLYISRIYIEKEKRLLKAGYRHTGEACVCVRYATMLQSIKNIYFSWHVMRCVSLPSLRFQYIIHL